MRNGRALLLALLALSASGCGTTAIPAADLPDATIAFNYLTQEEARRRAESWSDQRERQLDKLREQARAEQRMPGQNEMRANADQLEDFFGKLFGRSDDPEASNPGRLALLDPRSGKLEVLESARRGSVPLSWSADRSRLLFAQPGDRDFQIYEYEPARGTVRPVTHGPPAHPQACYAAEGRIVVAAADTRANPPRSRIELSRPGGVGPYEPLSEWGAEHSPSCAPDGGSVVWERTLDDGRSELRLRAPLVGGETQTLSPGRQPRFSPDGAWIVFSSRQQNEWRVWRVRPDGSGRSPVGHSPRSESRPAVSPDSRFVVYVASEQVPRRHLYLRRFDGSGDRILFANGDGEYPVW